MLLNMNGSYKLFVNDVYMRCQTIKWLRVRYEMSFESLDMVQLKVYINRLESELGILLDKMIILINDSSFHNMKDLKLKEELWLIFEEINKELGYP